jgi:iron complex transport system permease protein
MFWTLAVLGAPLWNVSRLYRGAGVPPKIIADSSLSSPAAQALLWASVGSLVGVLGMALLRSRLRSSRRGLEAPADREPDPPVRRRVVEIMGTDWLVALSGALLTLWALGQGPNLWLRNDYLGTDGINFLLTATTTPAPLIAAMTLAMSLISRAPRATQGRAAAVGALWWICTLAVGTRLAIAFPLAVLVAVAVRMRRRRPTRQRLVGYIALMYSIAYLVIFSFSITLALRGRPHGIMRLPELIYDYHPSLWLLSWSPIILRMVASVSASYVVTNYSVLHPPPAEVLWLNANPLPQAIAGVDAYSYERMAGAEWVPLSMAGEWFGVYGPIGQIALFGLNAFVGAWSVQRFSEKRLGFLGAFAFVLTVFVAAVSVQYPSRWFWRLLSISIALPAAYMISSWFMRRIQPLLADRLHRREESFSDLGTRIRSLTVHLWPRRRHHRS